MAKVPPFEESCLEGICKVLGDTFNGLTGGEIGRLLEQCGIEDPGSGMTKWYRLFQALKQQQERDHCGNKVVDFIQAAMNPTRYTENPKTFTQRREKLNKVLAFAGYELGEDGKLQDTKPAKTLSEAEERAGRLRAELQRREIHPDVLRFCQAELLQGNYFHAILEAIKSLADKIRNKTGLTEDGSELIDRAFGGGKGGVPKLAFNNLKTQTERSEHNGMMNLMKGLFLAFRNPAAHAPKIHRQIDEQDALDLLSFISFLHRRLDSAVLTEVKK